MITKLSIRNFKVLKSLDLENVAPFTLIGGLNNVGKSTLLEAVFLLFDRLGPNQVLRQFQWRGLGVFETSDNSFWGSIFSGYQILTPLTVRATLPAGQLSVEVSYAPTIPIAAAGAAPPNGGAAAGKIPHESLRSDGLCFRYKRDGDVVQSGHVFLDPPNLLRQRIEELIEPPAVKCGYVGSRVLPSADDLARFFGELDRIGAVPQFEEFVRNVDDRISNVSLIPVFGEPVLHARSSDVQRKIPIAFLGDGVARAASMYLTMTQCRGACALFDEIETGLHFTIQSRILRAVGLAARNLNCQVLATTHSYELLRYACEAFEGELADDFRYIRLEHEANRIVAHEFDLPTLTTAIQAGLEVR